MLNTIVGAVCTFYTFNYTVFAIFPDFYIEEHADDQRFLNSESTHGIFYGVSVAYFAASAVISILLIGMAHSRAYTGLHEKKDANTRNKVSPG